MTVNSAVTAYAVRGIIGCEFLVTETSTHEAVGANNARIASPGSDAWTYADVAPRQTMATAVTVPNAAFIENWRRRFGVGISIRERSTW